MSLAKEAVKFHQDFRTYGDDYKHWPPVVETAKVLWTQYFADIEKRVLFPTVRRRHREGETRRRRHGGNLYNGKTQTAPFHGYTSSRH